MKVGGGSGLLSMIVPEAQRSFTSYLAEELIHHYNHPIMDRGQSLSAQRAIKSF